MFSDIIIGRNNLFEGTPTDSIINFKQGDVIGYSAVLNSENADAGVLLDPSFGQEVVWYDEPGRPGENSRRRRRRQDDGCDFLVGPSGGLTMRTMAGPILSAVVCKYS